MANERYSAADLETLRADAFLDNIQLQLMAGHALQGGQPDGLIHALDYRRGAWQADGIAPYSPGTDTSRDLNVRATFANEQPMARKNRGHDQPRALHVLVDTGERYRGATGKYSLAVLARIALGMAYVAAESAHAQVQTVVVNEGHAMQVIDDKPFDSTVSLVEFDNFAANTPEVAAAAGDTSPLAKGLTYLSDYGPSSDSDVCMVVSDFTSGAEWNKDGSAIKSLDWEDGLHSLHQSLEDRLFVVRLTTPALIDPAVAAMYSSEQSSFEMDELDFARFREEYIRLGTLKAERIGQALKAMRHVDLSSTDPMPLITTTDFVFGAPLSD